MAIEKKGKTSVDWTLEACDTVGYSGIELLEGSPGKRNKTALQAAYAGSPIYSSYVKELKPASSADGESGKISYDPKDNGKALKKWFMEHVVNGTVSNPNLGINDQSLEFANAPDLAAVPIGKGEGKVNILNPYVPNLKSPGEGNWTDKDSQPAYDATGTDKPTGIGDLVDGNGQATLPGENIVSSANLKAQAKRIVKKSYSAVVSGTP